MADLLNEIKAQIAGAKTTAAKQNMGVIREVGDGVAKIEGLSDAMLNEMIDLGNGVIGLALNLEETEVGVVILGRLHTTQRGRRSPHHRQAFASAGGQGAAGPRCEPAGRAHRRQRPDQERQDLSGGKNCPRYYSPSLGQPTGANRNHAD